MSSQLPSPQKAAYLPQLCAKHQRAVVQRLKLAPDSWWQGALMATQLACFRATSLDPRFIKRTEGDIAAMSIVLAEIGCLGCWQPRAIEVSISIMRRDGDYIHLFDLAYGTKRLTDPLWPLQWVLPDDSRPAASEAPR
jgi:hypothetical protein